MYRVRNILLLNVVVIIFLHSLVSHRHHGEMTFIDHKKTHENADNIFDYLGLAFQQGEDYSLENFISEESARLKCLDSQSFYFLANPLFAENGILFIPINTTFKTFHQNSLAEFIIRANGLRAPPNYGFYS
jgi:hypothetical protein